MLPIFDTDDMVKMCYKFNLNFKKNKSAASPRTLLPFH